MVFFFGESLRRPPPFPGETVSGQIQHHTLAAKFEDGGENCVRGVQCHGGHKPPGKKIWANHGFVWTAADSMVCKNTVVNFKKMGDNRLKKRKKIKTIFKRQYAQTKPDSNWMQKKLNRTSKLFMSHLKLKQRSVMLLGLNPKKTRNEIWKKCIHANLQANR